MDQELFQERTKRKFGRKREKPELTVDVDDPEISADNDEKIITTPLLTSQAKKTKLIVNKRALPRFISFVAIVCVPLLILVLAVFIIMNILLWNIERKMFLNIQFPSDTAVPNGIFYTTPENLHILKLNGTHEQMGYAHGTILGEMIVQSVVLNIRNFIFELRNYEKFVDKYYLVFNMSNYFYHDEIRAMYRAIVDSHVKIFIEQLDRNLTIADLFVLNIAYDLGLNGYGDGCSCVGIAKEYSVNGDPLFARILDSKIDPFAALTQTNLIIMFNNQTVSFTHPGIIGVSTGFNSNGVFVASNKANGREDGGNYPPKFVPLMMLARRFLETQKSQDDIHMLSLHYYQQFHFFPSFLYFIGNKKHSFVLEELIQVVAVRGYGEKYVILTNDLRELQEPVNCPRYERYSAFFHSKRQVGSEDLLTIQRQNQQTTVICLQFFPKTLDFRIGYAKVKGNDGGFWSVDYKGCNDPLMNHVFNINDL